MISKRRDGPYVAKKPLHLFLMFVLPFPPFTPPLKGKKHPFLREAIFRGTTIFEAFSPPLWKKVAPM